MTLKSSAILGLTLLSSVSAFAEVDYKDLPTTVCSPKISSEAANAVTDMEALGALRDQLIAAGQLVVELHKADFRVRSEMPDWIRVSRDGKRGTKLRAEFEYGDCNVAGNEPFFFPMKRTSRVQYRGSYSIDIGTWSLKLTQPAVDEENLTCVAYVNMLE